MNKIKEFFEWLDFEVPTIVSFGFIVSVILVVAFLASILIAVSPHLATGLLIVVMVFFLIYPIYLFYKENKDI
jgi:archaellum biogenesis protein FlaJ (TadC family)